MGTRSFIAQKTEDGYRAIYCHWDGYPSWNGRILHTHYSDPAKLTALLNLGDISCLGTGLVRSTISRIAAMKTSPPLTAVTGAIPAQKPGLTRRCLCCLPPPMAVGLSMCTCGKTAVGDSPPSAPTATPLIRI